MASQSSCILLHRSAWIVLSLLVVPAFAGLNRDKCYADVTAMLQNGTLAKNDTCFYRDEHGLIFSQLDNPIVTVPGCEKLCGGKNFTWYSDRGPRVSTWILPILLLLSNMEVSPLDKRRYWMLVHLIGDPIDSIWSLLSKLEAWSRCRRSVEVNNRQLDYPRTRNLAAVVCGFEELVGFHASPYKVYEWVATHSIVDDKQLEHLTRRAARKLSDSRTDERLRTILAVALYYFQVVSAFVNVIGGGNTSPPGGRIGIAMFMTWIVPAVLLSNAIGGFTSSRICFDVLEEFVQSATGQPDLWVVLKDTVPSLSQHRTFRDYLASMCWSGAIYTYRPTKKLPYSASPDDRSSCALFLLAFLTIVVSTIAASLILWHTPPIGINCRNLVLFVIFILWCISAIVTYVMTTLGVRGSLHWHLTLLNDALIAIPTVMFIFFATCGLFNSCWCWSAVYSLGKRARLPLNTTPEFDLYFKTTYPLLVGVDLGLQIVIFVIMMWVGWRGWVIMRWSEKDKMDEWTRSRHDEHVIELIKVQPK